MNVVSVSVTERGRAAAARLPFEHVHGGAAEVVPRRWNTVDGFVLFLATGAAVRIVAPLLADKTSDPAVVCVDEAGRFAVALCGGHAGGANELARYVAGILGAEAVVTTATDATGTTALDQVPGFTTSGDVAGVTRAILDGQNPSIENPLGWPLPASLPPSDDGPCRIVVTDRALPPQAGTVLLHPASLVVAVGTSTDAPVSEVSELVEAAVARAGLARASVTAVATIDRRAAHPAITGLGLAVRAFPSSELARVSVPSPSDTVARAVGTPSVAEAAALLAAGPGGELVVPKHVSAHAAVAVARRRGPRGHLSVVGLGPGHGRHRTPAAAEAVSSADVVIGYGPYVDQCADLLSPTQEVLRSPVGSEELRAKQAVVEAAAGRRVAVVSSGDSGVYAMASPVLEAAEADPGDFELEIVPGVTAGHAAAALLGAPLGHDHVAISLSDLLTPWSLIETRVRAAAEADLVVAFYNPRSRRRTWQLDAARQLLLEHRPPSTPVGIVTDAARPGQQVVATTLAALDPETVGMTACVVVGSSSTRMVRDRMVTPRRVTGDRVTPRITRS